MPKSENQKLKLLLIKDMLYQRTDDTHYITTQEIIAELGKHGVKAERKSIYQDIQTLEDYGLDIVKNTGKPWGYCLASREFELAELKMLVDVVQSSRFLTEKKSRELIKKLEGLTDVHNAKQLQRQVVVAERTKSPNENIYYNVDMIHHALAKDCQIGFQYFQWTVSKEMELKKNGTRYLVSPWLLVWDNENYYLIAYDEAEGRLKYYRVDKMLRISLENKGRLGKELMEGFDIAGFSKRTFGMFSGEPERISLRLENTLIGVVIDRFGTDVTVRQLEEGYFEARMEAQVSSQFFGWIAGLGEKVQIISPRKVREQYVEYLQGILKEYR